MHLPILYMHYFVSFHGSNMNCFSFFFAYYNLRYWSTNNFIHNYFWNFIAICYLPFHLYVEIWKIYRQASTTCALMFILISKCTSSAYIKQSISSLFLSHLSLFEVSKRIKVDLNLTWNICRLLRQTNGVLFNTTSVLSNIVMTNQKSSLLGISVCNIRIYIYLKSVFCHIYNNVFLKFFKYIWIYLQYTNRSRLTFSFCCHVSP